MAKRIIWTSRAQNDRREILEFWAKNNKSTTFSRKLNSLFIEATQLIKVHPKIGQPTDIENVRVKIIRNYLMFYELSNDKIYILTIWDSRRNPKSFEL
jgi:toxin YoeB